MDAGARRRGEGERLGRRAGARVDPGGAVVEAALIGVVDAVDQLRRALETFVDDIGFAIGAEQLRALRHRERIEAVTRTVERQRERRFDLGRYRSNEKPIPSQIFDVPGLITLHCDIHEHMRGLILVLDTPHFARTGTDGSYRLTRLPAGQYTLKVWLDSKTTLERRVELRNGATLHLDFP